MINLKVIPENQRLAVLRDDRECPLNGCKEGTFMPEPKVLEIFSDYI
jgi:hypothetical protein